MEIVYFQPQSLFPQIVLGGTPIDTRIYFITNSRDGTNRRVYWTDDGFRQMEFMRLGIELCNQQPDRHVIYATIDGDIVIMKNAR